MSGAHEFKITKLATDPSVARPDLFIGSLDSNKYAD